MMYLYEGKQRSTALSHVLGRRTINSWNWQCRQASRSVAHSSGWSDERKVFTVTLDYQNSMLCIQMLLVINTTLEGIELPPLSGWDESSKDKQLLLLLNLLEQMEMLDPPRPPRGLWEPGSVPILSGSRSEMVLSLRPPPTNLSVIVLVIVFGALPF